MTETKHVPWPVGDHADKTFAERGFPSPEVANVAPPAASLGDDANGRPVLMGSAVAVATNSYKRAHLRTGTVTKRRVTFVGTEVFVTIPGQTGVWRRPALLVVTA